MKLFTNVCFQNLLKTAVDCCRTEQQIQWDAWGSVHTARVAHQCLHANFWVWFRRNSWLPSCPNLNPCRHHVWGAMHEAFLKASSEAKHNSKLKVLLEKTREIFRRTKLSRVLERGWESTWSLWHFAVNKKCSHALTVLSLVLNAISARQFLMTSKRQVATIKSSAVLSVLDIMQSNFPGLRLTAWSN